LLLGHKTQQQIEWRSNHSNEPSLLALLSSREPSFEYSITREQLLIYVLHNESTYTYLCLTPVLASDTNKDFKRANNNAQNAFID
jgi:hypothetical protein